MENFHLPCTEFVESVPSRDKFSIFLPNVDFNSIKTDLVPEYLSANDCMQEKDGNENKISFSREVMEIIGGLNLLVQSN